MQAVIIVSTITASLLAGATAHAQVVERPERPIQGVFGGDRPNAGRTRQELSLGTQVLGGYDDNLAPPGYTQEFAPRPRGYMGVANANLRYFLGRDARSIDLQGQAYMHSYRNIGLTPSYGGDLTFGAQTKLGSGGRARLSQTVRYIPFFSLLPSSPMESESQRDLPHLNPTLGLTDLRSVSTMTTLTVNQRWKQRNTIGLNYGFQTQTYENGPAFDSRGHSGLIFYDRSIGRRTGLRAAYSRHQLTAIDFRRITLPQEENSVDFGFRHALNVSRTRRMSISAGGGGRRVETLDSVTRLPLKYWTPSGYGTALVDIGRTWTVSADYRRAMLTLQGLTLQTFIADTATAAVGGLLPARVEVTVTAAHSNGQAGAGADGRFTMQSVTGQLRFPITRWWSALASYTRYRYILNGEATETLGLAPRLERNAVRFGFTLSLPLIGPYLDRPAPSAGGGAQ